jgi:hypothetical protein
LFTIRNGVVGHLARVAINIRKDFAIQNFTIFIGFFAEIIPVDIIFLFFNPYCLGILLFNPNDSIVCRINAVIVIRSLLVGTTRGHKEGGNHQYGGGSKFIME